MGGLAARRLAGAALALALAGAGLSGCASGGPRRGSYHTLQPGETIYAVARRSGVSVDAIVCANRIDDVHQLRVGTRLWIPEGEAPEPGPAPRPASGGSCAPVSAELRRSRQERARSEADVAFEWPLRGPLTTCFGERHSRPHEGIDIQVPEGTPVRAAEAGRVIYSDRMGAYGNLVVVKHAGGYTTLYAHNRRNRVSKGDFVEKGEVIADSGATGNATGPHLHFELRRERRPEDPALYLP